ncbi:hypothetical protein Tco_1042208 [Tanacetum coccineum]|uniref:Uncharacterized protein n=1 Tax=Tanacetum coccineum TaxID=301880 RepID=A0ABQ5GJ50_9ASTR
MKEHRASMEAYKKVHKETVRSELRMAIVQQSMEMYIWEIKEKLSERREQMRIRAFEEDKRREELNQKIDEGSRLGLIHCAVNKKRKKRKGPFVWTKSKSHVIIEVGQTEARDGRLNCDSRLATYEQSCPCQHFLVFNYDP